MAESQSQFAITKPVKAWNKPLKADFRQFFKGLGKAIFSGSLEGWGSVGSGLGDATAAIGVKTKPGERAWLLVRRALSRATNDIVSECAPLLTKPEKEDTDYLLKNLDWTLEDAEVTVDRSIWVKPKELTILDDYAKLLAHWLKLFGLNESKAEAASNRLKTHYVFALRDEWQVHPDLYSPLRDALDVPPTEAAEREEEWERYLAHLERMVDESMMGEPFGLRQVYVPSRAYYVKPPAQKRSQDSDDPRKLRAEEEKRVVVELEDEIRSWLPKGGKKEAVRVISGGPGSGKSSSVKMLAATIAAERSRRVIYVPLHLFNTQADLEEAIGNYLVNSGLLNHNPLKEGSNSEHLLLIFDGLDELAMRGRGAQETAREFVRHLCNCIEVRNTKQIRTKALLAGRTVAVQENESSFKAVGQVLNLLPYCPVPHESEKYEIAQGKKLMEEDRRKVWWRSYGGVTGNDYDGLPKELDQPGLTELTAQPLLNFLVAMSHARGEVDFSNSVNLNRVYEDLLSAVYDRAWGCGQHPAIQTMKLDFGQFVRILEEVGLSAWHGDGRTTTVADIERHCTSAGLQRLLDVFQEGAAAGVSRLLTAFYFRQHGHSREGDKTFEFTHKSFGEYLTARRIVRALRKIDTELRRHEDDPDDGWEMSGALEHWYSITGPSPIDDYIYNFLGSEVALVSREDVPRWQGFLCKLIEQLLRNGFPLESFTREPHLTEQQKTRNAGEALLAALSVVSECSDEMSTIQWPQKTSAGTWIRQLQGQRSGAKNVLAMKCLRRMSLQEQSLYMGDFLNADLSHSSMEDARASCAIFLKANLRDAILVGAVLDAANLKDADLLRANLRNAALLCANLNEANLLHASLQSANLQGANLRGANLHRANLEDANLKSADLKMANLTHANLKSANLKYADLPHANLKGAYLKGANLNGAVLKNANLEDVDLTDARLDGANIEATLLDEREQ